MAAGGGRPRWDVDICCAMCSVDVDTGRGGRDLLAAAAGGKERPVDATAGEKREVDGGVGGV